MTFTNAHRVEVDVCADGPASATSSGPPPLRRRRAPANLTYALLAELLERVAG
jgi:CubicO group peptidase (beta-lactamase class C family)